MTCVVRVVLGLNQRFVFFITIVHTLLDFMLVISFNVVVKNISQFFREQQCSLLILFFQKVNEIKDFHVHQVFISYYD